MKLNDPLMDAVRFLRIGNHAESAMAVDRVMARPQPYEIELKAATIRSEIADHDGYYDTASKLLAPFKAVSDDLEALRRESKDRFSFTKKDIEWWRIRQKLFYQWQSSVALYRAANFAESRRYLRIALDLAKKLTPRPEGLLTQLFFGNGKIEFQMGNHEEAARSYRESIVNAAAGPVTANDERASANEIAIEEAASIYSTGKAMALGIGQCLREQGRFEEAYPMVLAGLLLLERSGDLTLIRHAQQTLASIERGTAGEREERLLRSASMRLERCVEFFKEPRRDEFFRSRYELGLVYMQQGLLPQARELMQLVRQHAEGNEQLKRRPKWIANACIGLSRIERRDNRFEQAIITADEALAADSNDQKKITRRARGTRARALAARAINSLTLEHLEEAKKEIEDCLAELRKDDVRNRLTLDLWKALVLNAMDERPEAEWALKDYEKNAAGVDVGRIQEFAEHVTNEVRRRGGSRVGLPIESGDLRWKVNLKALKRELIRKVAGIESKSARARELDVTRPYYLKLEKELEEKE